MNEQRRDEQDDDIRSMFDPSEWIFARDLKGRDVTLTIASVNRGKLVSEGNKKSQKPVLEFVELEGRRASFKLALNKTNVKTLAKLYGTKVSQLKGKRITIYPTTTKFGSDTVDCIRIRNVVPKPKGNGEPPASTTKDACASQEKKDERHRHHRAPQEALRPQRARARRSPAPVAALARGPHPAAA